jgi:DNA polymerase III subunit delta'
MAASELEDDVARAPETAPLLERANVPWLEPVRARLDALQAQGRMPHGVLLTGVDGAGQLEIAAWLGASLLCRARAARPCGECADCRLFRAGNHPDVRWVGVLPDKKDIGIDQLRALSESLSMRSYRGGAKVAIIAPADAMSAKAHNALLKTLEEPASETYLVLTVSRVERIPKTILSRCLRIPMPLPEPGIALAWLAGQGASKPGPALLALAAGAPFRALEYQAEGLESLEGEMQEAIAAAAEGRLDFVAFADLCARNSPGARLAWLESWLTRSLKDASLASDAVNNNRLPWLRPPGLETKIRAGFGLLDQLREARRLAGGSLNMQLLFEGLAVSLAALVRPKARGPGESAV